MGIYEQIKRNIKDIRCQKDMSISELAELADISERNLYRIEAGERHPGIDTLLRLSAAFSVDIKLITGDISLDLLEEDIDE